MSASYPKNNATSNREKKKGYVSSAKSNSERDSSQEFRDDIIKSTENFVSEQLRLLKPVKDCWQPSDILPKPNSKNDYEELRRIGTYAKNLSNEILIVLVGSMITEEALPSYQTWVNRLNGITDPTGTSETPWAQWTRGWTAEEVRHGTVLWLYLYLTSRVNMRAVEMTTQFLIRNGFNPNTDDDPYKGFIYTSFQERATKISHTNTKKLAEKLGDPILGKICGLLAGDEARHEVAYKGFVGKFFELDPNGSILAFEEMMRRKITMPAKFIYDGKDHGLFKHYSEVAQQLGIYTVQDYLSITRHLISEWNVPSLSNLSGEASRAQEYLCDLPKRYIRLADLVTERAKQRTKVRFSWIFDQTA